jgi:hypothetical protein
MNMPLAQVPFRIDPSALQALPRALPEPISLREGYDSPPVYLSPEMASLYMDWAATSFDPNFPPPPARQEKLNLNIPERPKYENNAYGDIVTQLPEPDTLKKLIKNAQSKKKKYNFGSKNVDWNAFIRDIGDALGMIKGGEFVENPKAGRQIAYKSPGQAIGRYTGSPVAYTSGSTPWTGG